MKDIELLPCPFCGAACHFEKDEGAWEWVECESCGMQGNRSASLMDDCKPILAAAWNRRAAIEADRAQRVPDVDALADKIAECLHGTYHCNRVWEAWHVGTMSQDDFEPVDESETPREIAEEIVALLASTPAPAQQEPSEAEMVCAEAYQVVGCLLSDLGLFETEAARKILDNLSEARMVHQDVLPWESAACAERDARIAELEAANEAFGKRQEWWNSRMLELERENAELVKALAEARKDAELLDYIQTNGATVEIIPGTPDFYPVHFRVGGRYRTANENIRAAIRAAIKEQT